MSGRLLAIHPFTNRILQSGLQQLTESGTLPSSYNHYGLLIFRTREAIYIGDKVNYPIIVYIDGVLATETTSDPQNKYQYRLPCVNSRIPNAIQFHISAANSNVTIQYYGYGPLVDIDNILRSENNLYDVVDKSVARSYLEVYSKSDMNRMYLNAPAGTEIYGLGVSKQSSTNLTFSPGVCITKVMSYIRCRLTSNITKNISQQFSEGNNGGMLYPSQTYDSNGYYVIYLIAKSNGNVDFVASRDNISLNNLPSGFVGYRRLMCIKLNSGIPDFIYDSVSRSISYRDPLVYTASLASGGYVSAKVLPSGLLRVELIATAGIPETSITAALRIKGDNDPDQASCSNAPMLAYHQINAISTCTFGTDPTFNVVTDRFMATYHEIYTYGGNILMYRTTTSYYNSDVLTKIMIYRYSEVDL